MMYKEVEIKVMTKCHEKPWSKNTDWKKKLMNENDQSYNSPKENVF